MCVWTWARDQITLDKWRGPYDEVNKLIKEKLPSCSPKLFTHTHA